MSLPPAAALAALSWAGTAGLWACAWASWRHFRGPAEGPCRTPMTLIRPVRGLDDSMEEAFESIAASDPAGVLQVVVALESADDPAYPAARAFRARHPARDIAIVLSGPAGGRMGKTHNMIAGLSAAAHPFVLFSDADARLSPALLAEAERAFRGGADAVYALPFHLEASGFGGWAYMAAFNHAYSVPAALMYRAGQFRSFAGAFMGYSRRALEGLGGLEERAREIADDFALGRDARRAGLRQDLLRAPVFVGESGRSPGEALAHLCKWAAIVCRAAPGAWLLYPALNPVLTAAAALLFARAGGHGPAPAAGAGAALAAALASRVLLAFLLDRALCGYRLAPWRYGAMLLADLASLPVWLSGPRRFVSWRGRRYRLRWGGACEVAGERPGPASAWTGAAGKS